MIFAGHVRVGGSVSFTVTVKLHDGPTPVVTITVVVPIGKKEPDAGVAVTVPQLPEVLIIKFTIAPHWLGSLLVIIFAGHVTEQDEHSLTTGAVSA